MTFEFEIIRSTRNQVLVPFVQTLETSLAFQNSPKNKGGYLEGGGYLE